MFVPPNQEGKGTLQQAGKIVTKMIVHALIENLTAMWCFVVYINVGGSAVKTLTEEVERELTMEQRPFVLVVNSSTHMWRIHYVAGMKEDQSRSVSEDMRRMSMALQQFMTNSVNPIREDSGKHDIPHDNFFHHLVLDDNAVTVVDGDSHPPSLENLRKVAHEQAVARGMKAAWKMSKRLEGEGISFDDYLAKTSKNKKKRLDQILSEQGIDRHAFFSMCGQKGYAVAVESVRHQMGDGTTATQAATRFGQMGNAAGVESVKQQRVRCHDRPSLKSKRPNFRISIRWFGSFRVG